LKVFSGAGYAPSVRRAKILMKIFLLISLLIISNLLIGCSSLQIVSPEYLQKDSTKNVRITTVDGSIIKIRPNNYTVSTKSDSLIISGKGKIIAKSEKYIELDYNGSISKREIVKIEIVENSIPPEIKYPLYAVGAVSAICLVLLVIGLISLHGHGLGG
jgi:hypothetical protein